MKSSVAIASLLVLSGCVATDVGNPQDHPPSQPESTELEVEMEAYIESSPTALTLADGVQLTEAWLVTDGIELEGCENESEEVEDERDFEMITATELLTGTSYPASPLFGLEEFDFCGFELDPAVADDGELPSGAPADLNGLSMLVRGILKDGTTFEIRAESEEEIALDGEIHVEEARLNQLVLGFAVNDWVSQADLGAIAERPLVISPDDNSDVYERFEEAVGRSARLFAGSTSRRPIAVSDD